MNATEIRELETDELHGRIGELKEELFNLRFQLATGQLDNHRRMKTVKREIARIRTILRERDFATAAQMASEGRPAATPVPVATTPEPAPEAEVSELAAEPEES